VLEVNDEQHPSYQAAREAELDGDSKDEAKQKATARRINDAAWKKFEDRNASESATMNASKGVSDGKSDGVSAGRGSGQSRFARRGGDGAGRVIDGPSEKSGTNGDISSPQRDSGVWSERSDGNDNADKSLASVHGKSDDGGSEARLRKGVTVLIGSDSHGIVRGGNPNFSSGGRWSVETPDGTKTFKGSQLTPIAPEKSKTGSPWVGIDVDKTLAKFEKWKGLDVVGKPIPEMVERVKKMLADGKDVRIFTARVSHDPKGIGRAAIEAWCHRYLGKALPVTCVKDQWFIDGYDDRMHRVEANTGKVLA
jgi:hypothetical protein